MIVEKLEALNLQLILTRAGMVVAVLLALWVLRRLLQRIILPRLGKLTEHSDTSVDDTLFTAVNVPLQLFIASLAISLSAEIIWQETPGALTNFARTLLIIGAFAFLYNLAGLFTRSSAVLTRAVGLHLDEKLLPFLRTGMKVVIVALAVVVCLQEWDFDVAGLVAGLGVGGLAIALAAEDTIANLFGFTTIVGDRTLAEGEFIITPDVSGSVEHVGLRSTRIRQLDRALVTIPNKTLANSVVTNWTRLTMRRLDSVIGLTYHSSQEQIRELTLRIEALLRSREEVIQDSVTVFFKDFGPSSLDVRMIANFMIADWAAFQKEKQEILFAIMDIMQELGLSFAFPSQSLYIEQTPAVSSQDTTAFLSPASDQD